SGTFLENRPQAGHRGYQGPRRRWMEKIKVSNGNLGISRFLQESLQLPTKKRGFIRAVTGAAADETHMARHSDLWVEHVGLGEGTPASGLENAVDFLKGAFGIHMVQHRAAKYGIEARLRQSHSHHVLGLELYMGLWTGSHHFFFRVLQQVGRQISCLQLFYVGRDAVSEFAGAASDLQDTRLRVHAAQLSKQFSS